MTNSIKLILLCALILSGCLIFWGYQLRTNQDLKGENKLLIDQYQKELQARRNLEKMVTKRDSLYSRLRRADKDSFKIALARSSKSVTIYREKKTEPTKLYSNLELDSIINKLTK